MCRDADSIIHVGCGVRQSSLANANQRRDGAVLAWNHVPTQSAKNKTFNLEKSDSIQKNQAITLSEIGEKATKHSDSLPLQFAHLAPVRHVTSVSSLHHCFHFTYTHVDCHTGVHVVALADEIIESFSTPIYQHCSSCNQFRLRHHMSNCDCLHCILTRIASPITSRLVYTVLIKLLQQAWPMACSPAIKAPPPSWHCMVLWTMLWQRYVPLDGAFSPLRCRRQLT